MTNRWAPRCAAVVVLLLSLVTAARSADASIVTIRFTATVDVDLVPYFGQFGDGLPVDVSLTYDTALGTQVGFFPAGSKPGAYTLASDFSGWSADGVIATNVTFGTKTWTVEDSGQPYPAAIGFGTFDISTSAVPEPASLLFVGTGLLAFAARCRRRR